MKKYLAALLALIACCYAPSAIADQIYIISHQPLTLSKVAIKKIFMKKLKALPGGQPVVPFRLSTTEPGYSVFAKEYLGKTKRKLRTFWSRRVFTGKGQPPASLSSSDMITKIQSTEHSIGYIYTDRAPQGVHVVTIK